MHRLKLNLENLVVDSFEMPDVAAHAGPMAGPGAAYIEPNYSARDTCPEGNCAPHTQGGQWQDTCNACSFTCWAC